MPVSGAEQEGPAHFLGKIGIFQRREAIATIRAGEPEIPQTALAGLCFQGLANFDLAISEGKTVPAGGLADLGVILVLERQDLVAHHGPNLLDQRLDPLGNP